jgi:aminopeptidase N
LTNISFETTDTVSDEHLRVDFSGKEIKGLLINDQVVNDASSHFKDGAISIPQKLLKKGQPNSITVQYKNDYDRDGNGCVSFIDTDQKQYLYTQFEPYFANRVFPLFDQPNLKASLALTIACPSEW